MVVPFQPRRLVWLVNTIDALREFPSEVRTKLGFGLYLAQIGKKHESAKPLYGFGAPVWEVRAEDRSGTFRAVYVVHLRDAVYVLHAFEKKTRQTRQGDIELARRNFADVLRHRRER